MMRGSVQCRNRTWKEQLERQTLPKEPKTTRQSSANPWESTTLRPHPPPHQTWSQYDLPSNLDSQVLRQADPALELFASYPNFVTFSLPVECSVFVRLVNSAWQFPSHLIKLRDSVSNQAVIQIIVRLLKYRWTAFRFGAASLTSVAHT